MANVLVADQTQFSTSVQVSDTSPLSLARLKTLKFSNIPIISDFDKPMDQFPLDRVGLEVGVAAPSELLAGSQAFGLGAGVNASFTLRNSKQKALFEDDEFAPSLPIPPGECWAGISLALHVNAGVIAADALGFGVFLEAGSGISHGTLVHFPAAGLTMPHFKEGIQTVLERYSIPTTAAALLSTPVGIAHTSEMDGSVSLGALYAMPLTVNPLATVGLPFNLSLNITPSAGAAVTAAVSLEGSFVVRTFRSAQNKFVIGLYKKHQTAFTASLITGAGVGVFSGNKQPLPVPESTHSDLLGKVLNAVEPGANADALGLPDSQKDELNEALKHCLDHSLSIAVNACCTAADADEAAVIYELDLSTGESNETIDAVTAALKGDWSKLASLQTARPLRHVLRDLKDRNQKINVNLLGLYNATSIADYLKSTTILQDENGHITMVDKVSAQTLSAGTEPYAAKPEKLRFALTQAFIATVTYGACTGKAALRSFTVRQSFLDYHAQANSSDVEAQLTLAKIFAFSAKPELAAIVASKMPLTHNRFYVETNYDLPSVYRFFYQDVDQRTPYTPAEIDRVGRNAKIDLLDPLAPGSMQRRSALSDDALWTAMNECGNVAAFKTLPGLAKLPPAALQAISADWIDIRWWSDAMHGLTPPLTAVLVASARSTSSDPTQNPSLMAAHRELENALAKLTAKTHSAFHDGWPVAVMYRLATQANGPAGAVGVEIDISVNGISQTQTVGPQIAKSQSNSG